MNRASANGKRQMPASIAAPRLVLFLCVLALLLIGFVMVYSASSIKAISEGKSAAHFLANQILYAGAGVLAALVLWKLIPLKVWKGPLLWVVLAFAVLLLGATALVGDELNGAKRWLPITTSIGIQPSEFAKVAFILAAARIVSDMREGRSDWKALSVEIALVVVPLLGLVFKAQSDLGTTLICVVGILAVMWFGEVPLRVILGIIAVGALFAFLAIVFSDYRSGRFVFLDPWNDGQGGYGDGYQIIRSYYAFAEGGLFGVGLGNSHEKYLYLFASESDFIFAIIGEELGLLGALAIIALFLVFLYAGVRIARVAAGDFGAMVAGGFTVAIVFQAFLNIGSTIGALPTTGKPLPFVSSGGSSMIATFMMVGLILAVAQEAARTDVYRERRENLRVVHADAGARNRR